MSKLEHRFDVPFIARLALREKQIQQSYRPIIAVHKWFARRPGTLFRGLLLSEFAEQPLTQAFYQGHQFSGLRIADPFMGGGAPLLEANRMGFDVDGFDINPMAWWIVRQEIEHLDLGAYRDAAAGLRTDLHRQVGDLYQTQCEHCDQALTLTGPAKRGVCACPHCGTPQRYPRPADGHPRHRLFALEYHCPHCRPRHQGRFFKAPDTQDLERVAKSEKEWAALSPRFVPDDPILPGDESDCLHRWDYSHYHELFNALPR